MDEDVDVLNVCVDDDQVPICLRRIAVLHLETKIALDPQNWLGLDSPWPKINDGRVSTRIQGGDPEFLASGRHGGLGSRPGLSRG